MQTTRSFPHQEEIPLNLVSLSIERFEFTLYEVTAKREGVFIEARYVIPFDLTDDVAPRIPGVQLFPLGDEWGTFLDVTLGTDAPERIHAWCRDNANYIANVYGAFDSNRKGA